MIPRYCRAEMAAVWSDAHRLSLWLEVELAATAAREHRGDVPAGTVARLRERARIDPARMLAIETEVRHDVIAFLSMLAESVGDDARHVHTGMTSSDLVDTALALQIQQAGRLLLVSVDAVHAAARGLAERWRGTPMVGRTHGVHAEPTTFGLKCLVWSEDLRRSRARIASALAEVAVGKYSGAVGTFAHLDPSIEEEALAGLGLAPEPVANQVVQRDRHAALLAAIAVYGGSLERIALEIRHLMRTEVREAEEPFAHGQKGSSAMPHKRNPVRCERICGLARLLRAYALTGFENQALWHERDISHSSVERVVLPDAFLVADYVSHELAQVLTGLVVHPDRMRAHLDAGGGLVHSQRVLLALTSAGLARDEAYAIVQGHAMTAADGGAPFRDALLADARVRARLDEHQLAACFDLAPTLRHEGAIYSRVAREAR